MVLDGYKWLHSDPGTCGGAVCFGSRFPVEWLLDQISNEPRIIEIVCDVWYGYDPVEISEVFRYAAQCVRQCELARVEKP